MSEACPSVLRICTYFVQKLCMKSWRHKSFNIGTIPVWQLNLTFGDCSTRIATEDSCNSVPRFYASNVLQLTIRPVVRYIYVVSPLMLQTLSSMLDNCLRSLLGLLFTDTICFQSSILSFCCKIHSIASITFLFMLITACFSYPHLSSSIVILLENLAVSKFICLAVDLDRLIPSPHIIDKFLVL